MARRKAWSRGVMAAAVLSVAVPARAQEGTAAASAPAAQDEAALKEAFAQARESFRAKRYEEAHARYLRLWEIRQTFDLAANLAQVEMKLGKKREAAEHLAYALRAFPITAPREERGRLEHAMAGLRKELGVLQVTVRPGGAEVIVDGRAVGKAPLGGEVFVEPGSREIEARAAGYEAARKTVEVGAGGAAEVTLELAAVSAAGVGAGAGLIDGGGGAAGSAAGDGAGGGAGGAEEVSDASAPVRGRSAVPAIVLGSVGAAALVGGLVLIGVAESKRSTVERLAGETGGRCPAEGAVPAGKCTELADAASSGDTLGNVGIGGLVLAGAAGTAAVAYLLWPAPRAQAAARVRVAPVIGTRGGAVVVGGSF